MHIPHDWRLDARFALNTASQSPDQPGLLVLGEVWVLPWRMFAQ
jgi:hypothetical protein